jgi:hypothetical protein
MPLALGDRFVDLAEQELIDAGDQVRGNIALHRQRLCAGERFWLRFGGKSGTSGSQSASKGKDGESNAPYGRVKKRIGYFLNAEGAEVSQRSQRRADVAAFLICDYLRNLWMIIRAKHRRPPPSLSWFPVNGRYIHLGCPDASCSPQRSQQTVMPTVMDFLP